MRSVPGIFGLLILLGALSLFAGCGDDDSTAPQVNLNTVWFEEVAGAPGEQVTMDIMFHNNEPIIMVQLPFTLSETACQVVDFNFAGVFADPFMSNENEDSEPCRYNTWAAVMTSVAPGDHLYATITFAIGAEAQSQDITIEDYTYIGSFSLDPDNNLYKHFPNFGTMEGKVMGAEVEHGTLSVVVPTE